MKLQSNLKEHSKYHEWKIPQHSLVAMAVMVTHLATAVTQTFPKYENDVPIHLTFQKGILLAPKGIGVILLFYQEFLQPFAHMVRYFMRLSS